MPNQEAISAYLTAIGNIQDDLDALQEFVHNNVYDDVNPDQVNWGHVNRLVNVEMRLAEIVAELYPEHEE